MLSAINLNDQSGFQAREVGDVAVNRHLPTKPKTLICRWRKSRHKARSASVMFLRSSRAFWFGIGAVATSPSSFG
jgi:hypothetical protein